MALLYLDCSMGAAGDMLGAALYELLDDKQKALFMASFKKLGIPNVELTAESAVRCGIRGTHFHVMVNGKEEGISDAVHSADSGNNHEHVHEHDHHHHTTLADIEGIVSRLDASAQVKSHIMCVYRLIADAESHAHGVTVEEVHFHEVGAMDAVADVAIFALLHEMLGRPAITSSAVNVGSGVVHCAHGVLPVPAPATVLLLKGIPFYKSRIEEELCTPTGAALLRHFVTAFDDGTGAAGNGRVIIMAQKIGHGVGTRDLEVCNCVRAFLCESGGWNKGDNDGNGGNMDEVTVLECEIDDMTGEELGFACARLMEEGALDVHTAPVYMKKGRPGVTLTCISRPVDSDKFASLVFRLTTTLGMRVHTTKRYVLDRTMTTNIGPCGIVTVKHAEGWGAFRSKVEAEDIERIAHERGVSFNDAERMTEE